MKILFEVERIYNDDGQLVREEFRLHGKTHNPDGPAISVWNNDGVLVYESFRLNNKLHNTKGPALQIRNNDGQLVYRMFSLFGKPMIEEEWRSAVELRKMKHD